MFRIFCFFVVSPAYGGGNNKILEICNWNINNKNRHCKKAVCKFAFPTMVLTNRFKELDLRPLNPKTGTSGKINYNIFSEDCQVLGE